MSEQEALARRFEAHRHHLQAVAYRMLGSLSEAEDAVQECWLRLGRSDPAVIENLGGWLTTVISRICLDMLRARKSRREEPLVVHSLEDLADRSDGSNPEQEAVLADAVGLALLVVLGKLSPAERVAFVLHDVFAMPFSAIAPVLGKSEANARQLASRARRRVQGQETAPEGDLARQRELVEAFIAAAHAGDFAKLIATLDPDVVVRDDRRAGAPRITRGAQALAEQISGRIQAAQVALVNGSAGIIAAPRGKLLYVLQVTIRQGKIAEIDLISDIARLQKLELTIWESE
jgi:RNA polymerase sigma factor (sigma-70 family)